MLHEEFPFTINILIRVLPPCDLLSFCLSDMVDIKYVQINTNY